jgi:serine/threonine protein kinase
MHMTSRFPSSSQRPLDRLGPYVLAKRIASGGMAEIYLGYRDSGSAFRKYYAIKVLHHARAHAIDMQRMLADEARLVSQLDHPNIVGVHDFGDLGESSYVVMDYVHGFDLRRLVEMAVAAQVRLPDVISAYIVAEVCEGLAYAHSRTRPDGTSLAIVHRDISPPNILVSFDGDVRVADFGVARAAIEGREETRTGVIKGKLQYMAPEYAAGDLQDGRGDIFAAGLVLYELLTNTQAYHDAEGIDAMIESIKSARIPDLRRIRPDLPEPLFLAAARALAPRPAHRYQLAEEMAADLRTFVSQRVPGFTRSRARDVLRQLLRMSGRDFPEKNALLGPTLEATGLDHLVEIARAPERDQVVSFDRESSSSDLEETIEGRLYVNSGEGSYPDAQADEPDEWAIAPTSKHQVDQPGPRLMTPSGFNAENQPDPNVPPPRILSPSGYVRDVDEWERRKGEEAEAAIAATKEIEFDEIVEIPAAQIEPIEPTDAEEAPTGKISGDRVRGLRRHDE